MPRARGQHGRDDTKVVAVRLQNDVADAVRANGTEWLRNVIRRALNIPLDYDAGYEEGKAAGWADASERFRAALKGA